MEPEDEEDVSMATSAQLPKTVLSKKFDELENVGAKPLIFSLADI
jgi:hypothetical protein